MNKHLTYQIAVSAVCLALAATLVGGSASAYEASPEAGGIGGQLVWETDEPAPDVTVDLYQLFTPTEGDPYWALVKTTYTDDGGAYLWQFLMMGDYRVVAVAPPGTFALPSMHEICVPMGGFAADFTLYYSGAGSRSIGYWKHQVAGNLDGKGRVDYTSEQLSDLLAAIHARAHFPTVLDLNDIDAVLTVNKGGTMRDRARQHLLALEFNSVCGNIHILVPVDLSAIGATYAVDLSAVNTVGAAIDHCWAITADAEVTDEQLAMAREIAAYLNKWK